MCRTESGVGSCGNSFASWSLRYHRYLNHRLLDIIQDQAATLNPDLHVKYTCLRSYPKSKNATNKKLCCRDLPVIQDQNGILSLDPIEIVAGESH